MATPILLRIRHLTTHEYVVLVPSIDSRNTAGISAASATRTQAPLPEKSRIVQSTIGLPSRTEIFPVLSVSVLSEWWRLNMGHLTWVFALRRLMAVTKARHGPKGSNQILVELGSHVDKDRVGFGAG